jgi:hypothetical protein
MRRFIIYGALAVAYVSALFGCGSQESKKPVVQPSRLEKKVNVLGSTVKSLKHASTLMDAAVKECNAINDYFKEIVHSPILSGEEKRSLQTEYITVMDKYNLAFNQDVASLGFASVRLAWMAAGKKHETIRELKSFYTNQSEKEKEAFESAYRNLVRIYENASKRGRAFLEKVKSITSTH